MDPTPAAERSPSATPPWEARPLPERVRLATEWIVDWLEAHPGEGVEFWDDAEAVAAIAAGLAARGWRATTAPARGDVKDSVRVAPRPAGDAGAPPAGPRA